MSYNKIRHIKKSNLLLENRLLKEDDATGIGQELSTITRAPIGYFKYFDTKKPADITNFYEFANYMSTFIQGLDKGSAGEERINYILGKLDGVKEKVSDYEKKLIDFMKTVISNQKEHFKIKSTGNVTQTGTTQTSGSTQTTGATQNLLTNSDNDYDYKKENNKYYFKLKENPKSESAKKLKSQGKFINWTLATKPASITAIKSKFKT
jgi:hypothetical protein